MTDLQVVGGESNVYEVDARRAFANSAEPDETCELLTDVVWPLGEGGDGVFRRLYVPIEYENGIEMEVVAIIDGKELSESRRTVVRTGSGVVGANEPMCTMNRRGGSIAVKIVVQPPTGRFSILNGIQVAMLPGSRAKVDKSLAT